MFFIGLGAYIIFLGGYHLDCLGLGRACRSRSRWNVAGIASKKDETQAPRRFLTWGCSVEFGSKIGSKNFKADNRF